MQAGSRPRAPGLVPHQHRQQELLIRPGQPERAIQEAVEHPAEGTRAQAQRIDPAHFVAAALQMERQSSRSDTLSKRPRSASAPPHHLELVLGSGLLSSESPGD